MRKIIVATVIFSVLASCKTGKIAKETFLHDTIYRNSVEKVLDSVYVDRYNIIREKGDTVFVVDSVMVTKFKDRNTIDTIYRTIDRVNNVTDTVEIPVVPTYYKVMHLLAWILIAIIVIMIAIFAIKLYIKR